MKKQSKVIKVITCPRCGYVWEARVSHPKSCPDCKVRIGYYVKKHGKGGG